jgi:hypothetical protein
LVTSSRSCLRRSGRLVYRPASERGLLVGMCFVGWGPSVRVIPTKDIATSSPCGRPINRALILPAVGSGMTRVDIASPAMRAPTARE